MSGVTLTDATRNTVRLVADGTGLTVEEVWLVAASTVVATGVIALLRAAEVVTDLRAELQRSVA